MDYTNPVMVKSKAFAIRIIRLYKYLSDEKREFILSKQVLRSGTSIGANIREGVRGQTKPDFYAKLNIALKEQVKQNTGLNCCTRATTLKVYTSTVYMPICRKS